MHISNLYRPEAQAVLLFREVYAMEKVHGTSAHVAWKAGLSLHAGGAKHENFAALFDQVDLTDRFKTLGHDSVTVYGEAYGGKLQGMRATYGPELRFIAFEVRIGDTWLAVPNAEDVAHKLGLEFVPYSRVPATIDSLDAERDAPSALAWRRDIAEPRPREGIVIRPLAEFTDSRGERIIAKHKRAEFSERAGPTPDVRDPTKREAMEGAEAIALEWVTDMRLTHVLDKLGNPTDVTAAPQVIAAMVEDVCREASGEIVDSKPARRAIGARAVRLFKARLAASLHPPVG